MKLSKNHSYIIVPLIILAFSVLSSCGSVEKGNNLDKEIMTAEKPLVDSIHVPETLDLYRAKRFESIQEAFLANDPPARKLVLYGRRLGNLSPEIGRLTYLASLDIAFNELTSLPGEIANLHYLQGFYANGNSLTKFPEQLLLLPILEKVDLSENQIGIIPGEIVRMKQLTRLSMDRNQIMEFPLQLYELENLKTLELADNGLSVLPEGISNLKNLRKLDLANNQLSSLPREIATMESHLSEFNVQGNHIPLEEINWFIEAMPSTRIRY